MVTVLALMGRASSACSAIVDFAKHVLPALFFAVSYEDDDEISDEEFFRRRWP